MRGPHNINQSKPPQKKPKQFFVVKKTQHLYLQLPGVSVLEVPPGSSHHMGCAETAHGSHSLPVSKLTTCSSFLPSSSCPPPNTPPAALLSLKSYLLLFSMTVSSGFAFTHLPGHLWCSHQLSHSFCSPLDLALKSWSWKMCMWNMIRLMNCSDFFRIFGNWSALPRTGQENYMFCLHLHSVATMTSAPFNPLASLSTVLCRCY